MSVTDKNRVRKSTNLNVLVKNWDSKKQRPTQNAPLRARLDSLEDGIWNLINSRSLDDTTLSNLINPVSKHTDLDSIYNAYLEHANTNVRRSTFVTINSMLGVVRRFGKAYKIEDYTHQWHNQFMNHCIRQKMQKNTFGAKIKALKTFLKWADRHYPVPPDYKDWVVMKAPKDVVYLTRSELTAVEHLNIVGKLSETRDLFVLQCNLGLRVSDLFSLDSHSRQGDFIMVTTSKTVDNLRIPLTTSAKRILDKYNNQPPKIILQHYREQIKKVCELAGLDYQIHLNRYYIKDVEQYSIMKYKAVSTHTARRTFITLSLENGIRPETVMAITGHKTYKMMQQYIKIADQTAANEINKAWG